MAGIFDAFLKGTGDPEKDAMLNRGLLAAGLALMQSRGRLLPAVGQAGMAGLNAADQYAQQRSAAQSQQLQRQMAQLQLQNAQREQAIAALPGRFMAPGGGQAVDATGGMDTAAENPNNVARPEGQFDFEGYFRALRAYDPMRAAQAQAALQPRRPTPVNVPAGGSLVDPETGKPIYTAPFKPEGANAPSAVQEYEFARQNGYKGTFEQWKKEIAGAGATQVSFGSPIPAINPKTGEPEFVRPDNRGGMSFTGVKPPPQNRDTKMPAEIQRMNIAADTMGKLLDQYETMLDKYNPRDPTVQMNPATRAEFQSLMKALQLQFKEVQALGALAGPDLKLMEDAITDPFTFKGIYYGKDGLRGQIKQSRKLLELRKNATDQSQGVVQPQADNDPLGLRGR